MTGIYLPNLVSYAIQRRQRSQCSGILNCLSDILGARQTCGVFSRNVCSCVTVHYSVLSVCAMSCPPCSRRNTGSAASVASMSTDRALRMILSKLCRIPRSSALSPLVARSMEDYTRVIKRSVVVSLLHSWLKYYSLTVRHRCPSSPTPRTMSEHVSLGCIKTSKSEVSIARIENTIESKTTDYALPLPPVLSQEEQQQLWRKVDRRILPILSAMYMCCYLDRGSSHIAFADLIFISQRRKHWYIIVSKLSSFRKLRSF